jgi:ABC-2 type transport system ATP-binding protein
LNADRISTALGTKSSMASYAATSAHAALAPPDGRLPVKARGLVKRYKQVLAVDHVDLNVHAGEVYGFLGPNGAGKTTTLRMLLGLIMPTEGKVELFGRDPIREGARALQGVAGFVEAPRFYPYLSGLKNLQMMAALDGGDAAGRVEQVLRAVDLQAAAQQRVGTYSHGMGQRLGIAGALLRDPQLLILDEPATGLDPAGMRDMRVLIRRLAGEGITVLLSSHQLPEVQEICDRVAIIRAGKVAYEGPLAELRGSSDRGYRLRTSDDARAFELARVSPGIHDLSAGERELRFQASERDVGALSLALGGEGVAILGLTPVMATLEDLFFELTEGAGDGTEGLEPDGHGAPGAGGEQGAALHPAAARAGETEGAPRA